jgi:serine/threonine protein kinase
VVFDRGEMFADIEIQELLAVTRSSALYKALRGKVQVLLKVAHHGCEERLKREAQILAAYAKRPHPMLPVLLPAYGPTKAKGPAYGKTMAAGEIKYYEIFQYAEGDLLRNILLKTPQPWYQHVAWITIGLADAIAYLHQSNRLHFCLSPEVVLVRFDKEGIPRPLLIDLGVASDAQNLTQTWDRRFVPPAYTAPELIQMQGKVGAGTDVYGLGLVLYEMLAGRPAFEYKLERDEAVYEMVLSQKPTGTGRTDLKIADLAERAISRDYANRPQDIVAFAKILQSYFPRVPRERKKVEINWGAISIVALVVLGIVLLGISAYVFAVVPPA